MDSQCCVYSSLSKRALSYMDFGTLFLYHHCGCPWTADECFVGAVAVNLFACCNLSIDMSIVHQLLLLLSTFNVYTALLAGFKIMQHPGSYEHCVVIAIANAGVYMVIGLQIMIIRNYMR